MHPILARLIANATPDFMSPTERAEAAKLHATFELLSAHCARYAYGATAIPFNAALQTYRAAPSDDTLIALEVAYTRLRDFGGEMTATGDAVRPLGKAVGEVKQRFLRGAVLDWARPICARARAIVEQNLAAVEKSEERRMKELTGISLSEAPDIVAAGEPMRDTFGNAVTSAAGSPFVAVKHKPASKSPIIAEAAKALAELDGLCNMAGMDGRENAASPAEWLAIFGFDFDGKLSRK